MRLIVLGIDASGASCVTEQKELAMSPIPGISGSSIAKLFSTDQSPPPPRVPGQGKFNGGGLAPGLLSWYVINHEPVSGDHVSAATELHHRDAIDLIMIMDGGGDMMLGTGAFPVTAGDCIVMYGIDHGLRPGPQGARLMAFAIGSTPRND
jgi:mannose-6-phosphate isomerase-like protein (cupin superfamily)